MPEQIIILECVFGGRFILTFEPRSIAWPSIEFPTYGEAMACADAHHKAHEWSIVDLTEAQHG